MGKKNQTRSISFIRVFINFFKRIRVLHKYLLDRDVSILKKILVLGMIFYVLSPLDLLPDPILGFGFIDDTFIVIYVMTMISTELDKYIGYQNEPDIDINKEKIIDNIDYDVKDE